MSITPTDTAFAFLPFYVIVETELKRMLEFVKSDCFTFIVNGEHFESTIVEAVLISPAVCDICTARRWHEFIHSFVIRH
jgi:hypothetical protein